MSRPARLDRVLRALADPTRRRLLLRLCAGPATVGELAAPLPMSLPAVSRHLTVLARAGLVRRQRQGRTTRCRLDPAPLAAIDGFVERARRRWARGFDPFDPRPGR